MKKKKKRHWNWILVHKDEKTLFCNWHPKGLQGQKGFDVYTLYVAYGEAPPEIETLDIVISGISKLEWLAWRKVTEETFEELYA